MSDERKSRLYPHVKTALEKGDMKMVVILALQRSGTSLLAAMLGRHPDVAMLYEAYSHDFFKLYGKPVAANKLLVPHQIHLRRKAGLAWRLLGYTFGRLAFVNRWVRRTYRIPLVHYSLEDLRRLGVRFIILNRDEEEVAQSMMRRAGYSAGQARKEIEAGRQVLSVVEGWTCYSLNFAELLDDPEGQARALCRWLDLPYNEIMLEGPEFNTRYPEGGPLNRESRND